MSDLFSPSFIPGPPPPPPAPPLPPQKYVNRATNVLARFAQPFIGASRPPSAQANRVDTLDDRPEAPRLLRPPSPMTSQSATHRTGIPIAAVDISPSRTHAVLAGREILKTIRVTGATCAEELNIRGAIINYNSTHNTTKGDLTSKAKGGLAANDVKWSHGNYDTTIATACANGRIMLFELNRAGVELARLHEHHRQVHKLAINPHQGYFLLSASQDATVRLWDLRTAGGGRSVGSYRSLHRYKGNSEGVRDVKWSPTDGIEFAIATDAGIIQRWDIRKDNAPLQKINAHRRPCSSLDWHPDGKHLVSAGADKMVHVWNIQSVQRRPISSWAFRAPHAISNVRWRPAGWHADLRGAGSWQTSQIVTSYDQMDARVHLWDLRRPNVPFRELDRFGSAPTDMLWHSEHLLWTVGKEGMFVQTDIHFAPKIGDRRPLQAFDVASDGEITLVTQKISDQRVSAHRDSSEAFGVNGDTGRHSTSGERLSGSRSSTDETSGSYLGSSFGRKHGVASSIKSPKSVSSTPPSEAHNMAIAKLDQTLSKASQEAVFQVAAYGRVYGLLRPTDYAHIAKKSSLTFQRPIPSSDKGILDDVQSGVEQNARVARDVALYRLSQTWKILGHVVLSEVMSESLNGLRITSRGFDNNVGSLLGRMKDQKSSQPPPRPSKSMRVSSKSSQNLSHPPLPTGAHLEVPAKAAAYGRRSGASEGDTSANIEQSGSVPGSVREGLEPGVSPFSEGAPAVKDSTTGGLHDNPDQKAHQERRVISHPAPRQPLRLDMPAESRVAGSLESHTGRLDFSDAFPTFSASTVSKGSFPESLGSTREHSSDTGSEQWSGSRELSHGSVREDMDDAQLQGSATESHLTTNDRAETESNIISEEDRMERSGTIVPDDGSHGSLASRRPSSAMAADAETQVVIASNQGNPVATATDVKGVFLSPKTQLPWDATTLFRRTIEYHLMQLSDSLTPAIMLIFFQPLLPPDAIDESMTASVLEGFHQQLMALGLFATAAHLRKLCWPQYPSLYEMGRGHIDLGFLCTGCGGRPSMATTHQVRRTAWFCEKCKHLQAPCPICGHRKGRGLWGWCQGCGHGGHASCLDEWWQDQKSEGGCALEGCLHDCMPGRRRKEREESQGSNRQAYLAGVRRDDWVASESKAVERVRGGLLVPTPDAPEKDVSTTLSTANKIRHATSQPSGG
ncbi:MAG: SEA (Seh1-associated) complex subunit [Caeruleum heppii]|nr:MAG: SEA (Seh1-associated) complex subunit [Caeruleum heppii]